MKENKAIQRRPLAELNLIDDFMFTEMVTQENEEDAVLQCADRQPKPAGWHGLQ